MSNPKLIYTHWSPSYCNSEPEAIGGEGEDHANSGDQEASRKARSRPARMPRAAQAEAVSSDSFESDSEADQPPVPPMVTFPGLRTSYRHVIKRLGDSSRSRALKYFRGRYSSSEWMQQQADWMESASLLASIGPFSLNPLRILFCSACGKLCFQPRWCTRCNLDQRVEPLQQMFKNVHAKRPFWHSLVLDYEIDADRAGVWTGPRSDRRALYLPHQGQAGGRFFRASLEQVTKVEMFCDFLFLAVRCLQISGIIDGWIAVVEPNLSFWPDPNSTFYRWNNINHGFLPHIHVLVCGRHPFDERIWRAIYQVMQVFLGKWSYANLWFNPVNRQAEISKWVNYCVKPYPLAKWYAGALRAGCDQANLNLIFDDLALEGCPGLLSHILSPRRGGVMAINSGKRCILNRLPPLLTGKQFAQCKDPQFYHDHEESFWRTVEKHELRRGRNPRFRTRTHRAAARRISSRKKQRGSK